MPVYAVKKDHTRDDFYKNGVHVCPVCLVEITEKADGKMICCTGCDMWICGPCQGIVTDDGLFCRTCYLTD